MTLNTNSSPQSEGWSTKTLIGVGLGLFAAGAAATALYYRATDKPQKLEINSACNFFESKDVLDQIGTPTAEVITLAIKFFGMQHAIMFGRNIAQIQKSQGTKSAAVVLAVCLAAPETIGHMTTCADMINMSEKTRVVEESRKIDAYDWLANVSDGGRQLLRILTSQ